MLRIPTAFIIWVSKLDLYSYQKSTHYNGSDQPLTECCRGVETGYANPLDGPGGSGLIHSLLSFR